MNSIIKEIDFQGFNQAVIKSIDSDGMILCDLQQTTQEGDDITIEKQENNYGFPVGINKPFSLHIGEEEYVKGLQPREAWNIPMIKQWLDDKDISYSSSATESELLALAANS